MSQEQNPDLATWWNEQSFDGKELYQLDESGTLKLLQHSNIKEREIATLSQENADVVLKTLQEKYVAVAARMREVEVEWIAAEDKLKLVDKVTALKEYVQKTPAVGDMSKIALLIHDWEHTIYELTEEHYKAKLKIAEQAESLADSDLWKETAQAFRDLPEVWRNAGYLDKQRNDQLWNRIENARKSFQERKRKHHEEEEKDLLANLDLKMDLVEQAESLAKSTEWKKTTETFHRLTEEWKTIGYTLNKKNEELWQRFLAAKSTFFENKRQHYNLVQAEQEGNYAVKLTIVERAEALKDSKEWNVTAQAYAGLMEEWKKTGRAPQAKADELWKRFTDAQEIFFDAKRKHTDNVKADLEQNYNLKNAILERVLKLQYSTQWGETTTLMNELMDEWKKIGAVPRVHSERMWEELNAARKNFFARKDASREQRKQYTEDQKAARIAHAKGQVAKLHHDIKEEEEKIVDFRAAIENITPGKKAEELRTHLTGLIEESTKNIAKWKQTLALASDDDKQKEKQIEKQQVASSAEPE